MHSCPKKISEAIFDWMATTALKTLINTIISTFQSTQKFTLWVLFSCFFKKFTSKFTLFLPYCFRDFKANSPTAIGTTLEVLT